MERILNVNGHANSSVQSMVDRAVRLVDWTMEALLLSLICGSPWAVGGVGAWPEFFLLAGISGLLVLWMVRASLQGSVTWKKCPVALCLAATVLLGIFQVTPLPPHVLSWLSPGTATIYSRLLPSEPEILQDTPAAGIATPTPVGSTISLYPGATRHSLVRLLAVLALFLLVRNCFTSMGAMHRLGIALLINGAALSLFGLIQFFTARQPAGLFEELSTAGAVSGPFVNRNHFAYYLNLCIGPTLGLLLARGNRETPFYAHDDGSAISRARHSLQKLLNDPAALWIGGALALMLASVVFCLSRGGFLAMLGATAACIMLPMMRGGKSVGRLALVLSVAATLALLIWLGLDQVEARLGTLFTGDAVRDGRVFVLLHSWSLISEFPVWGTGYGTFQFVEPLKLHTPNDVGTIYEHAHNDYLEDLMEGGALRLLIRLLAIGLIFRFADQAYRLHTGPQARALVLGLLFAFTSIVIHSFFEFGLYVPSIVVLATVLCGCLCNLGEPAPAARDQLPRYAALSGRVVPIAGFGLALLFAWFFSSEGLKAARVEDLRGEARRLRRAAAEGSINRAAEIPLLQAVVSLEPADAERRFVLAEAYLDVFKEHTRNQQASSEQSPGPANAYLVAGLQQMLYARNLCPLLPEPHARLAAYTEALARADERSAYMERAKFLAPADPMLWYLCGLQELADGEPDQAWRSWKQSLQLSERFLTRILDRAATVLTGDAILVKILPDDPDALLLAARHLYPGQDAQSDREPLLQRALACYDKPAFAYTPALWHTKAELYAELRQATAALDAYQQALAGEPRQISWRYELAYQLHEAGCNREARRELSIVLGQQPAHAAALKLMERLSDEGASKF